jgi:hypothetical protein
MNNNDIRIDLMKNYDFYRSYIFPWQVTMQAWIHPEYFFVI